MPYYHQTKQEALAAGEKFSSHFHVRAQMEPYNGWVIILQPLNSSAFDWPLGPLLDQVEIDLASFPLLRKRPADRKRPPAIERPKKVAPPPKAPPKAPPRPPSAAPAAASPPPPPPPPPPAPKAPA